MVLVKISARDLRIRFGLLFLLGFVSAAGCSTATPTGGLVGGNGKHPANFATSHPTFALPDGSACTDCHGSDLRGGISKVSCFTASRNGTGCHASGPAFHPLDWLNRTGANFHGAAFLANTLIRGLACTVCHDPANPNVPPGYNCLQCHFTPTGGRVPAGASYVHGQIDGHTTFGVLDNLNAVTSVCTRCHEINNSFGHMPQPFCHNCHSPAPAGFHPAGWANPDSHGAAAKGPPGAGTGFLLCQTCHGNAFAGTGSAPSCVNNAACHGAGIASPHSPAPWRTPSTVRTHTTTDSSTPGNPNACAWCHLGSGSVAITSPTQPPGNVTPGCFNSTLCHGNVTGAPHSVHPYATHPADARARFNTFCNTCHSVSPPRLISAAPACTECHVGGNPLTVLNCTSCHGNPPAGAAPVGPTFPNVAGAHAKHNALDNVAGICDTCHNGGGTGTGLRHFYDNTAGLSGIDLAFMNTLFKANSGNMLFTSADNTCTNIGCHGGIRTPGWRAAFPGTGDVCRQCHTVGTGLGAPESNSPYTGLHAFHMSTTTGGAIVCSECHNMANGTTGALNHYKFLNTPGMEGPASDTVAPNGSAANYNVAGQTCVTFTCHTVTHSGFSWTGGASHPVPFTGTAHTSVTTSTFAGNCGTCHFETGTSTKIGPTCTVCHQAGSPLTALNCTSCHANPPNNASTSAYPNVAGGHTVHLSLNGAGTPVTCNTCHNGLGTGTLNHYNRANARTGMNALRVPPGDAAFLATYNAKTGASTFDNSSLLRCSNVSCHGGQATPNWRTGTITVDSQAGCTGCHASGTAQYNSYNSGRHGINTEHGTCLNCHNTTTLATNHFTNLASTAMEGPASATIGGAGTSVTTYVASTRSCTPTCHGTETW